MLSLAVIILTYNEERHIARALDCVTEFAEQIFVIDSFSTDRTSEIARAYPRATVVEHNFINYSDQFQWALDKIDTQCDWIMRLDADEIVEADLVEEIKTKLPMLPSEVVGVNLKRKHIFMKRWIRHGGRYPLTLLRVWRRGHGRIENRWMDEHIVIWGGVTITFEGGFSDENQNDLTFFINKHNKYATREAVDRLNEEFEFLSLDVAVSVGASSKQARVRRFLKQRVYNHLPVGVGPLCYFSWRYFFQLGFLDGKEGLIYHFLQGCWYRFLVEAKVTELRRALILPKGRAELKLELSRLTGLDIK